MEKQLKITWNMNYKLSVSGFKIRVWVQDICSCPLGPLSGRLLESRCKKGLPPPSNSLY